MSEGACINEVRPNSSDGDSVNWVPAHVLEYPGSSLGKRRNLELDPLPNLRAYYDYWLKVMVQGTWGVLTLHYCNLNPSFTEHLSTEPLWMTIRWGWESATKPSHE